jgi:hypothetical protein
MLELEQVFCSLYYLTQKMEVTCSSEMSFGFQWATWHCVREGRALQNHCCENLKSYKV